MRPPITGIVRKYKRANFTRSKTGCLTCRGKKIKCIWGEGAPSIRKKRTSQQEPPFPVDSDSIEESRTSRAEAATPLTRSPSPPKQEPDEMGIPPMVSRRHSDSNREMPVNANAVRRPVAFDAEQFNGVIRPVHTTAPSTLGEEPSRVFFAHYPSS
ncbi:hypothetical protein C8Q70DRAFT_936087 [Cubamyces menziesii]|nr:hypothetical protein C8Q70DRAFT_936087 [Cubamyces menziesii]